ncbi:GNAT family N-acetyltransferase [Erwinia persicina]|uniref:N-acetyltransferase n=1 Tax=Erwinia persicina TaxID=55211 RepID=A0A4U3FAC7_9GAMM|nr:GNAT family N-acetyltransferase [Erwinia persicina]MBC3947455.1 GNAT family N-acetyltransferase [Erwinia persicina]MCQ4093762.1 GNAT family N-acetyltransferase [Erwinia persicina]MCQ4101614.1 GNAT family N-acetyltransferase [Erwinia persicina]TKJ90324.1 N-acetyltransferase [Erwinia persicina]HBH66161.1 N-acetyltransferase [Erwinia persicina]
MKIRLAVPVEAEECWNIRNQAIRYGCKNSYDDAVIAAWTPEKMPESYRNVIVANPFFVVDVTDGSLGATGFLDLSSGSVEAVFTLPQYTGKGVGSQIIEAIKSEARERGFEQLTLSSTPNAQPFYEKHGFKFLRESMYSSALAQAELRCMEMSIKLQR